MQRRDGVDTKKRNAENRAKKDEEAALGLTPMLKKSIAGDVVLCIECKATKMGPLKCECKGGVKRPDADYNQIPDLLAANAARHAIALKNSRLESAKQQNTVSEQRLKKKRSFGPGPVR